MPGEEYKLDPEKELHFEDAYLCGGYGQVNEELLDCIAEIPVEIIGSDVPLYVIIHAVDEADYYVRIQ